jgi:hypothetical protein
MAKTAPCYGDADTISVPSDNAQGCGRFEGAAPLLLLK